MAEDALCLMLHDMEKRNIAIPAATAINAIKVGKGKFVHYLDINFNCPIRM